MNVEQTTMNLRQASQEIREYIENRKYELGRQKILDLMMEYPDSPQPHNFMGLLLMKIGNRQTAIKHFRAAVGLDSTYTPAKGNLFLFSEVEYRGSGVYEETPKKRRLLAW